MKEDNFEIQDAIGYSFKGLEEVPFIESIIQEFGLASSRYWMRPATEEDWFCKGDFVVTQTKPILINEYDLTYDIPYNKDNIYTVMFVEHLIDTTLESMGLIEKCFELPAYTYKRKRCRKKEE